MPRLSISDASYQPWGLLPAAQYTDAYASYLVYPLCWELREQAGGGKDAVVQQQASGC